MLAGELKDLGKAEKVEVGFQYRFRHETTQPAATADPWHDTDMRSQSQPGPYTIDLSGLEPGRSYEYRAVVKHPKITLYGDRKGFRAK